MGSRLNRMVQKWQSNADYCGSAPSVLTKSFAMQLTRCRGAPTPVFFLTRQHRLDCHFESLDRDWLHQMFGETGREALLPICIAPEAADCDPTDARSSAQSFHQFRSVAVRQSDIADY